MILAELENPTALRERVARLAADEARYEQALHDALCELESSEARIKNATKTQSREALTLALLSQNAVQAKVNGLVENLGTSRGQLHQAREILTDAQARIAAHDAAVLEREAVAELLVFAGLATTFSNQCAKIDNLRDRARQVGGHLLTPCVVDALYPNWAEIRPGIESRLAIIAKCAPLTRES